MNKTYTKQTLELIKIIQRHKKFSSLNLLLNALKIL